MAANEMARDPTNAASDFIPHDKADLILHATPMIGPTAVPNLGVEIQSARSTRIYPFVCTFLGIGRE